MIRSSCIGPIIPLTSSLNKVHVYFSLMVKKSRADVVASWYDQGHRLLPFFHSALCRVWQRGPNLMDQMDTMQPSHPYSRLEAGRRAKEDIPPSLFRNLFPSFMQQLRRRPHLDAREAENCSLFFFFF